MENKQVESVVPNGGFRCRNLSLVTYLFVFAPSVEGTMFVS